MNESSAMAKKDQIKEQAQKMSASSETMVIQQPKVAQVVLEVTGTAPLIQNNFSQKSVEEMLRKHMGISVQREKKKPREVIKAAKIKNLEGRISIPPTAFKSAMITASTQIKGLKKTQLRTQLFVWGASTPITFDTETSRMDMVRTSGMTRTPDVRFRPMFDGWKARMAIQFGDALSVQSVVDLLNRAGAVGVGEWRPEKNGTFGTFRVSRHVTDAREIKEVLRECSVGLVPLHIPEWALDMNIDPSVLKEMFDDAGAGNSGESEGDLAEAANG
jgi:hypothetical protein